MTLALIIGGLLALFLMLVAITSLGIAASRADDKIRELQMRENLK